MNELPTEYKKALNALKNCDFCLIKLKKELATATDIDVLIAPKDADKARKAIASQGFQAFRTERWEKYKTIYKKQSKGKIYTIHLHRQISWHSLKLFSTKKILARKTLKNEIPVPSNEDNARIESAHQLFEHYKIKENKKQLIRALHPYNLWNLPRDIVQWGIRVLNPFRKGYHITILGMDGSGKTTIARKMTEFYSQLTGTSYYYFGWTPFLLTRIMKRERDKKSKTQSKTIPKCSVLSCLALTNYLIECWMRYALFVYPKLRRTKMVVCDRYPYDVLAQHPCANKKMFAKLLKSFPAPDATIYLQANAALLKKRKNELNEEQITQQQHGYNTAEELLNIIKIDASKTTEKIIEQIAEKTFNQAVKKMRW